jgi:hypothetical protein
MPWILLVGPFVAVVGIAAIFFVLRRKSVDKRSMYSARRAQIEHKVRAARQRTLTPHGRTEGPAHTAGEPSATSIFAPTQSAPQVTYEASAYEAPPAAPPPMTKGVPEAPSSSPWDVGPTSAPPSPFAPPEPAPAPQPTFEPAPQPTFEPAPSEPAWTPPPADEPASPVAPLRPASPAASPAAWSVVSEVKESASTAEDQPKKRAKGNQETSTGAWQLASGDAPGAEPDEAITAPGQSVAIALYAIFVVGLIAVLLGVLIMVAGSPVK